MSKACHCQSWNMTVHIQLFWLMRRLLRTSCVACFMMWPFLSLLEHLNPPHDVYLQWILVASCRSRFLPWGGFPKRYLGPESLPESFREVVGDSTRGTEVPDKGPPNASWPLFDGRRRSSVLGRLCNTPL